MRTSFLFSLPFLGGLQAATIKAHEARDWRRLQRIGRIFWRIGKRQDRATIVAAICDHGLELCARWQDDDWRHEKAAGETEPWRLSEADIRRRYAAFIETGESYRRGVVEAFDLLLFHRRNGNGHSERYCSLNLQLCAGDFDLAEFRIRQASLCAA